MWTIIGFSIVYLATLGDSAFDKSLWKGAFHCPAEYGIFANPHNCRRFYTCNGFVPYDTPCQTPLYFDDAKKMCVPKTKELQCGPIDMITGVSTTPDPKAAPDCHLPACNLPDCFCSDDGTQIPGNLLPKETPQMVILAFTGALNVLNAEYFGYLLNETRLNPNGCPIKATFFVPHDYTSYYYVQKIYGQGHEISMQTITNRLPENFWSTAGIDDWVEEVIGMKEILHIFGNISRDDLLGMRAPYLKPGGNNMMSMLYDYGLKYDSSIAVPLSDVPLWPYTLDYHIPHKCPGENCPSLSFPGMWEFPLNTMEIEDRTDEHCVFLDQCAFPDDAKVIFDFLYYNFERHYFSNRAPLLLNIHVDWVTDEIKMAALDAFIHHISTNIPDVWIVTMQQALEWTRNPVPTTLIQNFKGWKCTVKRRPGCNVPRTCAVMIGGRVDVRYLQVCGKCPERYPWIDNVRGTKDGKSAQDLVQKTTEITTC